PDRSCSQRQQHPWNKRYCGNNIAKNKNKRPPDAQTVHPLGELRNVRSYLSSYNNQGSKKPNAEEQLSERTRRPLSVFDSSVHLRCNFSMRIVLASRLPGL